MKRYTAVAALLALLLLFASCGGGTASPGTEAGTEAENSSGIFAERTDCRIDLYAGGETVYKMIRADGASDMLVELYKSVTRTMNSGGIGYYDGSDDWLRDPSEAGALKEILLGCTARAESAEVLAALDADDYAIVALNNKIVIAAHSPDKLAEAVEVFLTDLLHFETKDGGVCAYLSGTRVSRGGTDLAVRKHGGLEKYSIVYPAGSTSGKRDADTVAKAVKKVFGKDLPLLADTGKKTGPELVIGNADRDVCRRLAADILPGQSLLAEDGGDVVLMGDSEYATRTAVTQFIEEYVSRGYSDTLAVGEGVRKMGANYTFENDTAKAAGADIRVMSFNILAELWNDKPPIAGRDDALMAVLRAFQPDVIGLQEVSDGWYSSLDARFGDEFAIVDRKNNANNTNFSPIAYNKDTVKVLEHGVREYSQGNDLKLRLVSWGYFEVLATGKRFVAVSTHWDLGSNPQYLAVHCREMAKIVRELEEKYGCPVITTGDYNTRENTEYYKTFVQNSGYKDAKFTAAKVEKACKTTHTLGSGFANTPGNAIDHIFGSEKAEFLYYNILLDQVALDVSDHCPIYADVKLN